jgi:hypothetical protein
MVKSRFLNVLVVAIIALAFCLSLTVTASAQLPASFYYTQPTYYTSYGYANTITGYDYYDAFLLGYNTYSPFLAPSVADAYALAGLSVYPYLTNPYQTTFPYATLDVYAPYAPVAYPTFTYGDPYSYGYWVDLNL